MNNLEISKQIINSIQKENIRTEKNSSKEEWFYEGKKLKALRESISKVIGQCFAPALTTSVATTLFKVANCSEMAQKFIFEYFLTSNHGKINLIFTANKDNARGINHCFALIGKVTASENLILKDSKLPSSNCYVPITNFLSNQNKDTIIADPYLEFANEIDSCNILLDFSKKLNITHVIGVLEYSGVSTEQAKQIKENAEKTKENIIKSVLTKCRLDPNEHKDILVREKAMRRTAMSGKIEDLSMLLSTGINIDAQDSNPENQYTALHLALMHEKVENASYLIFKQAKKDIPNAKGITANNLISNNGQG